MAQVVLTIVGSYFGPVGAAIGGAIGGAIDRSFAPDPPDQVGPRMEELKVTTSGYGINLPTHFGTTRTAGNLIYAQDLREVRTSTETDAGGKGGGPTQTTITFSYFGTFAISAGRGVGRGVRRMWANGVLVWDATVGAASPDSVALDFTFYPGTPDQLPDPTMEADLGVGMVPGYRDEMVLMFRDVPLEKFGNRLPSFELEITMDDGEWGVSGTSVVDADATSSFNTAVQALDGNIIKVAENSSIEIALVRIDSATGETLAQSTYAMGLSSTTNAIYVPPTNEVWVPWASIGASYERFNADTLVHVGTVDPADVLWHAGGAFYDAGQRVVMGVNGLSFVFGYHWVVYELDGTLREIGTNVYAADYMTGGGSLVAVGWTPAQVFAVYNIASGASPRVVGATFGTDAFGVVFDYSRNRYIGIEPAVLWTIDDSLTPNPTQHSPTGYAPGTITSVRYVGGLDVIEVYSTVITTTTVTVLDAETLQVLLDADIGTTLAGYTVVEVFGSQKQAPGQVFGVGTLKNWFASVYGTTYAAAVRSLCIATGDLLAADVDVSGLGQALYGYSVAQAGPVRSAIEQLARADFFDGVEEDDLIKFPRRGGAAVATIEREDCGAGIDTAADQAISSTRRQELDLPARLYVSAPDPFTDYQPGTQYGERLAQHAGEDESEQFAVVMTATLLKRLADARLFDRWASREPGSIATSRKHALLSPTDPVTLDGRRVRLTSRSDEGGVIRFEWIIDDADVIEQFSHGAQGEFPPQTVPVLVPTNLIVMDLALLRDADNSPGGYVAAWGIAPYWRGMSLFVSGDGGVTYLAKTTLATPGSSVGEATTALANWTGGNRFDEVSTLTLQMSQGTPSGTTRALVLDGANGLALEGPDGWEVLQYRDVLLNGDGTYTLTGFLRGRRATEWAMAGHAIGDRAVLLQSTLIRGITLDGSELGLPLLYKPVTLGDTLAATVAQTETLNGERLKPFAPVDLRALRDVTTADITLTWRRRPRLSYRFLAEGIGAPLGEDTEAYVVKVWSDNTYTTLVRTIAATSQTAAYTSAQQVADFGSNQATVYVTVTQTSATVGAGHELQDSA